MKFRTILFHIAVITVLFSAAALAAEWKPVEGKIMTRWAADVSPKKPHPEYPRPTMVRDQWMNLNGLWDYAITPRTAGYLEEYQGKILVPFPVESALSGVGKNVGPDNILWYARTFAIPEDWKQQRVLLHFGASDWETTVWVNGQEIGTHRGGFDAFSFDITAALMKGKMQSIRIAVWDPTDAGGQPRGKQVRAPRGIWYTSVTGIWQTVWIEPAPKTYITKITTELSSDSNSNPMALVFADFVQGDPDPFNIEFSIKNDEGDVIDAIMKDQFMAAFSVSDAKMWCPESPHLYDITATLKKDGKVIDEVKSYFAFRDIEVKKDENGVPRLFLNGEEYFQMGTLDQGWWPDGLYTAPTDEALKYDIEVLKDLGFNMMRKHVKVEPERFYYWCDKLGILVWQDMPSGGADRADGPEDTRPPMDVREYEYEWSKIIGQFRNHPSIVMWVPFNESWGQFETKRITDWTKSLDPLRLVNNASGWHDGGTGDTIDIHTYPGPSLGPMDGERVFVIGEFGGLGLPVSGHTWQDEKNWGYRSYANSEELTDAYLDLMAKMKPLIGDGVSAAVYTQTTDVEIEVNGLLTYDRDVIKVDVGKVAAANKSLYENTYRTQTILSDARHGEQLWKYRESKPSDKWYAPDYDDSKWQSAPGGFGDGHMRNATANTEWIGSGIWLRREFELDEDTAKDTSGLLLSLVADQETWVYINGVPAAKIDGNTGYAYLPIPPNALAALKPGKNVIAAKCKQLIGNHHFDAGIVNVKQ